MPLSGESDYLSFIKGKSRFGMTFLKSITTGSKSGSLGSGKLPDAPSAFRLARGKIWSEILAYGR